MYNLRFLFSIFARNKICSSHSCAIWSRKFFLSHCRIYRKARFLFLRNIRLTNLLCFIVVLESCNFQRSSPDKNVIKNNPCYYISLILLTVICLVFSRKSRIVMKQIFTKFCLRFYEKFRQSF